MTPDPKGRGTGAQPRNRFDELHFEADLDLEPDTDAPPVPTRYYRDASRTILAENDSPDLSFRFGVNPYRGCEHGCVYCYARPSHEYLGFDAGPRLRIAHHGEGGRARAAARGVRGAALAAAGRRALRQHRLLPADRAAAAHHAALPRGVRRVPQPGRRDHQIRAGGARRRPPRRAGGPRRGARLLLDHHARPDARAADGAARGRTRRDGSRRSPRSRRRACRSAS